jgi:PAS domain S-box-containing protein
MSTKTCGEARARSEERAETPADGMPADAASRHNDAKLLEHVTRVAPGVLYLFDLDEQRNRYAQPGIGQILGYPDDGRFASPDWVSTVMHPDDRPGFATHLERMRECAEGETHTFEYRMQRADGEWRWFLSRDTPFARHADGRVREIVGAATDVTEQRQAAARLAESEAVFRQLAEANLIGVGVGDTCGGITYVNDEMLRMMGYTRADYEAGRVNWAECLAPESRAGQEAFVARLIAERRIVGYERAFVRPDGRRTPYVGAAALVRPDSDYHVSVALDLTRVRESQEELRLASERFSAAIQASPVIVFNQDRELRYTWIHNPALGYSVDEVIGKRDAELFERAEDAAAVEAVKRRVMEMGVAERVEVLIHDRGEERTYDLTVQPLRDGDGGVVGVTCAASDVTERKRDERRVRESEQQLRRVLDTLFAFVGVMTPDGTLIEANRAPLEAGGLTPADVIGRKFWDCPWWTHDAQVRERCREACELAARGEASRFDVVVRMKGDSRMTIDFTIAPMRDDAGRITHLVPSGVDIEERKRAEAALQERNALLQALTQDTDDLIWAKDRSGRLTLANPAVSRLFPQHAQVVGLTTEALIGDPAQAAIVIANDARIMTSGRAEMVEETVGAPGVERVFLSSKAPLRNAEGEVVGISGVSRDITARKRLEAERDALLAAERAARAEAERANQLKDEFLATVSHELRTPLNAMLGWTQVLARRQQDPALVREGLAVIERNARAQAQLIEDLLDMGRIMSGKLRLDVQTVDLHDVISRALETIRPVADAKSIRVSSNLDARVGAMRGDPDRLQQVVWNLLSNAVKFTPRGGWVALELVRRSEDVALSIQDSGQGIASELLPHVFDRFRQGDGTSSRRQGGLGLGLSIVRQLVELHGGTVRAESAGAGQGAKFIVELPLSEPDADMHFAPLGGIGATDPLAGGRATNALAGVSVLAVDDEADSLQMLARVLSDAGARVLVARSAAEALVLLERERPDVLVSDIGMPEVDGYELIRRVRALAPSQGGDVPATAVTAYARPGDQARALAAGYQAHLAKPVRALELIALIEALVKRPRALPAG